MRLIAALLLLLPSFAAAMESHAVVFIYQRIGEGRHPSASVRIDQFEAHLDWLAAHGYTVWPLERIVQHMESGEPIPDRTAAITVDGAYLSVFRQAYPRLVDRDWPFTVFVNTGAVDKRQPDVMTWDQMREMQSKGVRFANQGADRVSLWRRLANETDEEWRKRVHIAVTTAQARLQAELGAQTNAERPLFAYPNGEYTLALADVIKELGYTGFGQHPGAIDTHADRRALPRFPLAEHHASARDFANKATSLPMPVEAAEPTEPVVHENPPRLIIKLAEGGPGVTSVRCYLGDTALRVISMNNQRLRIQAEKPLARGRSRYDCTAPAGDARHYWFSHPWLVGQ